MCYLPLKRVVVAAFYKKSTSLQCKSWRQICTVYWNLLQVSSWQIPQWPWYQKKHSHVTSSKAFLLLNLAKMPLLLSKIYWTTCYFHTYIGNWTCPHTSHFQLFFLRRALLYRPSLKMPTIGDPQNLKTVMSAQVSKQMPASRLNRFSAWPPCANLTCY